MTVGDVKVGVAIVIEIRRGRSPGPAGAGHLVLEGGFDEAVSLAQVHPVTVAHRHAHFRQVLFSGRLDSQRLQTAGRGRSHARHVKVNLSVRIEVIEGVGHAKTVALVDHRPADIGECSVARVEVGVEPREVTDHHEVEILVGIEIDQ